MTTITTENIIPPKQAENSQTTQYTSTNVKTIIDKFTATNTTGSNATFACNIVPTGDAAGSDNLIMSRTILANTTYSCPELIGQVLKSGDFISTIAGTASAITIRGSGRTIS